MNATEFELAVCDYFAQQPEFAEWGNIALSELISEEYFTNQTIMLSDGTMITCEEKQRLDKNRGAYVSVYSVKKHSFEKRDTDTQFFEVSMHYDSWDGMSSEAQVQEVVPVTKTVWHQKNLST